MKVKIIILIFLTSILSTSCIEIVEEIWFNKDHSGKIALTVDAGSVGFLFSAISDYIDADMVKEINEAPAKYSADLKNIKGISEIGSYNKIRSGKMGISFSFNGQKSLNKAWYSILGMDKKFYYPKIIKIKNRKIVKKNINKYLSYYLKKNEKNIKSNDIFKVINYKTVYHLPANVSKINNETGTKLKDSITVIQTNTLQNILMDKVDLGQVIYF